MEEKGCGTKVLVLSLRIVGGKMRSISITSGAVDGRCMNTSVIESGSCLAQSTFQTNSGSMWNLLSWGNDSFSVI